MSLDWATLRAIAKMSDEIGILSVYLALDPHTRSEGAPKPPWEVRLRKQLTELRDRLKEQGPREHWKALTRRLDELQPELQRLQDPTAQGQGRALFAAVASGEVRTVSLQSPLVDRVVLEPRPHLWPLVVAWSIAGPAGAVSVSAEELRVVDLRFGLAEVVETIPYEGSIEQRPLEGPPAANPGMVQHHAPQHDLYDRREDEKLMRFLGTVGPRLAELVTAHGWGYLAITGHAALVQAVREGLPTALPVELVTLDHPVNSLPPPKLAATVAPALEDARRQRHRTLAERARDHALSGNAGALGLSETVAALQQGRVAHLLLDAEGQWSGRRTPEGLIAAADEVPPGVDPATLTPEPHLGERMLELAFEESSQVTMLDAAEAEPLADSGGVGALLRW